MPIRHVGCQHHDLQHHLNGAGMLVGEILADQRGHWPTAALTDEAHGSADLRQQATRTGLTRHTPGHTLRFESLE